MKQCHGLELRPEPCGIVSELPARCSASVGAVTAFSTQRWGSSALPVPVHTHFGAGFCHGGSFCQSRGSGRLEEPVPMLLAATHTEHGSLAHVAALWGVFIPASAVPGSLVVTHGAGHCRQMQGPLTASGSFPRGFPGPGCPPSPPHPLVALEQIFSQGRAPLQPSPPQQKSQGAVFSGS